MHFTLRPRLIRTGSFVLTLFCVCGLLIAAATSGALAAPFGAHSVGAKVARVTDHRAHAHAAVAGRVSGALRGAAAASRTADRRLVRAARSLHGCLVRHPAGRGLCRSARRSLERAGLHYASAEARLAALATGTAGKPAGTSASVASTTLLKLAVSGETLYWAPVANARDYVLDRRIGSQENQFTIISSVATSFTPPPAPGQTVHYMMRAGVAKTGWSEWVSIYYQPVPVSGEAPNSQTAPSLTTSGQTLSWSAVAGVGTYVLLTKVAGRTPQYTDVSGTSVTPPAVAGATVNYSIRTAVEGGLWSPEVSISYPAVPPAAEPASSTPELQSGIVSGHEPADFTAVAHLGAKLVRVGFHIEDTVAELQPAIEKYAAIGVRVLPLAEFGGRMPTAAEAQGVAKWASAFGPGGTFWAGRSDGSLAIKAIEFGNETDYSQQYHDEAGDASYRERGELYAVRVKEAGQAITAAGSKVGLLVQADDTSGDWMNAMYSAVPEITKYIAGWTMHSYGGQEWNEYRFSQLKKQAAEHGASAIPIDVTEWGVTSDNGRCLEYNDGLNPCMTYAEAAQEVKSTLTWMKAQLASKLAMFIFYQTGDQAPSGTTTNWQDYFGALGHEGQMKGPYTEAVEEVLHA